MQLFYEVKMYRQPRLAHTQKKLTGCLVQGKLELSFHLMGNQGPSCRASVFTLGAQIRSSSKHHFLAAFRSPPQLVLLMFTGFIATCYFACNYPRRDINASVSAGWECSPLLKVFYRPPWQPAPPTWRCRQQNH